MVHFFINLPHLLHVTVFINKLISGDKLNNVAVCNVLIFLYHQNLFEVFPCHYQPWFVLLSCFYRFASPRVTRIKEATTTTLEAMRKHSRFPYRNKQVDSFHSLLFPSKLKFAAFLRDKTLSVFCFF